MADYRADTDIVGLRPRFFNRSGTTEPDLVLIKQVEQVTNFVSGRTAPALCRGSQTGITAAVEVLVFLIWQLLRWLLFGCKNSQDLSRMTCLRRGSPANAAGSNRRFHEPGQLGSRAGALPNSVRLIHNLGNLACCPGFKMSHHLPPTCRARRRSSS